MQPNDRLEAINQIADKIKDIRLAMLTTQEQDGTLRSRPMAAQKTAFDGTLWFFTYADSPKVNEVQRDQQVNVSFADTKNQSYVSVSGTARLVRDRQRMQDLWHPDLKAWFPQGLDDSNLALLEVTATEAAYWDSPSSKVVRLAGLAKSLITGEPAQDIMGSTGKVDLS